MLEEGLLKNPLKTMRTMSKNCQNQFFKHLEMNQRLATSEEYLVKKNG